MFNRLEINGIVNDYSIPYKEFVSSEAASIEEMKIIVVENNIRPIFKMDIVYTPVINFD